MEPNYPLTAITGAHHRVKTRVK